SPHSTHPLALRYHSKASDAMRVEPRCKTIDPLDEARIALLRCEPSPLRLDITTYDWYRNHGVPRAAIDRAVTIMVARGEAELANDGRHVLVRFLERPKPSGKVATRPTGGGPGEAR